MSDKHLSLNDRSLSNTLLLKQLFFREQISYFARNFENHTVILQELTLHIRRGREFCVFLTFFFRQNIKKMYLKTWIL